MFRKSERYRTEIDQDEILRRISQKPRLKTIATQPSFDKNYDFIKEFLDEVIEISYKKIPLLRQQAFRIIKNTTSFLPIANPVIELKDEQIELPKLEGDDEITLQNRLRVENKFILPKPNSPLKKVINSKKNSNISQFRRQSKMLKKLRLQFTEKPSKLKKQSFIVSLQKSRKQISAVDSTLRNLKINPPNEIKAVTSRFQLTKIKNQQYFYNYNGDVVKIQLPQQKKIKKQPKISLSILEDQEKQNYNEMNSTHISFDRTSENLTVEKINLQSLKGLQQTLVKTYRPIHGVTIENKHLKYDRSRIKFPTISNKV